MMELAKMYLYSDVPHAKKEQINNEAEAIKYYIQAAEHGHCFAQALLYVFYMEGIYTEKEPKQADKWLRVLMTNGKGFAFYLVASQYSSFHGPYFYLLAEAFAAKVHLCEIDGEKIDETLKEKYSRYTLNFDFRKDVLPCYTEGKSNEEVIEKQERIEEKQYKDAGKAILRITKKKRLSQDDLWSLGVSYRQHNEFEKAIDILKKLYCYRPGDLSVVREIKESYEGIKSNLLGEQIISKKDDLRRMTNCKNHKLIDSKPFLQNEIDECEIQKQKWEKILFDALPVFEQMYRKAVSYLRKNDSLDDEIQTAIKLLKDLVSKGHLKGSFEYAMQLYSGVHLPASIKKYLSILEKIASSDSQQDDEISVIAQSRYLLGKSWAIGLGHTKNMKKAARWWNLASQSPYSNHNASYLLAYCYISGEGVTKDKNAALECLSRIPQYTGEYAKIELDAMMGHI